MDQDYISNLDQDAKEWLSQFNNEYYGNTLSKDWRKNLHYKEQKKAIYDATNARNRDMYNNRYKYNENPGGIAIPDSFSENCNPEGAYIDFIHYQRVVPAFIKEARDSGMSKKEALELAKMVFDID